jgi:2-succinyl-5-enolpyruvyl-6-hydroxy-3-cyclohexene-1-carboxylate synthase
VRIDDMYYDALLRDEEWADAHRPDLVVRLGAPMTSKPLNQWLAASPLADTIVVDEGGGWADPDLNATEIFRCDPQPLLEFMAGLETEPGWISQWKWSALAAHRAIETTLPELPLFEAQAVRALGEELRGESALMVGSSMPIRDVDTFWPAGSVLTEVFGNRGASGIDGLVSTGLGIAAARPDRPTVLLLGDLATYHDMNGLWAIRRHGIRATVVVLDNGGGGIFSFLPQAEHSDVFEEVFGTPLGLRWEDVARLYGLEFACADRVDQLRPVLHDALAAEGSVLVAVRFRRDDSVTGHRAVWRAVSAELRKAGRRTGPGI